MQHPQAMGNALTPKNAILQPLHQTHKAVRNFVRRKAPVIREVVREVTAGGIVFRHNPQTQHVEFLLIQDAKDRWTIPKGHIEPDEPPEETTAREILEETGVRGNITIHDWLGKVHFQYRREHSLVLMTMQVFLVQMSGEDTDEVLGEDWIHSVRWFSSAGALDAIEYPDIGKLILLAHKKIRQMRV